MSLPRRSRFKASLLILVPLGAWLFGGIVLGSCGNDVTCPIGTAGSPCRYTVGVGDPPALLPPFDVNGSDAHGGDAVDTMGTGDIDAVDAPDANEMNDGPLPDAADDGDEPRDARADANGEARADDETPDVLIEAGSAAGCPALRFAELVDCPDGADPDLHMLPSVRA